MLQPFDSEVELDLSPTWTKIILFQRSGEQAPAPYCGHLYSTGKPICGGARSLPNQVLKDLA